MNENLLPLSFDLLLMTETLPAVYAPIMMVHKLALKSL